MKNSVLCGAGGVGRAVLASMRQAGDEPLAFAVHKEFLVEEVDGVPVLSVEDAVAKYPQATFFVTIKTREINRFAEALKTVRVESWWERYPILWFGGELTPEVWAQEKDFIEQARNLWADDLSREIYDAHLEWKSKRTVPPLLSMEYMYFPDFIKRSDEEIFVDAGAYDGDTLQEFLTLYPNYTAYYAFEPDPVNLAKFPAVSDDRIHLFRAALGWKNGVVQFAAGNGLGSCVNPEAELTVPCLALDKVLLEATYIKMDIEGSESDALIGSHRIIEESSPVLAICLYHKLKDLWRIPVLIDSINSRYKLFLRTTEADQICFAVPPERL